MKAFELKVVEVKGVAANFDVQQCATAAYSAVRYAQMQLYTALMHSS